MIFRCTFRDIDGVRYLAGYRLVSEHGRPSADDELAAAPGPVILEDGRYRWRLVENPDSGKDGDSRRFILEDNPQPERPVDMEAKAKRDRRSAVVAALPDILLAVADGGDLREEIAKALARVEAR